MKQSITRRDFAKSLGAAAILSATRVAPIAAESPARRHNKTIGIQIPAVSFVDEGVEQVLDIVQQQGRVNTLFLTTFSYTLGTAGRQERPGELPDHGLQVYDTYDTFQGGSYTALGPRVRANSPIPASALRAPELGDFDVLSSVLPPARKRGLKCYAFIADNIKLTLPQAEKVLERGIDGKPLRNVCFNNPHYKQLILSLIADTIRSYPLDRVMWRSERMGAFGNVLEVSANRTGLGCFCEFCQDKAKRLGVRVEKAKEGLLALQKFVDATKAGKHPEEVHSGRHPRRREGRVSRRSGWCDLRAQVLRDAPLDTRRGR